MKKVIIILSICMVTTGCSSKTQPTKLSYDNPYDLTRLDFSMNVPEFMSGSIVLKRFVSDDENVDRDSESKINGSTGMYHFCHWVDEKLSERNSYYDSEKDEIITEEPRFQRWGIRYAQSASLSEPLATFHTLGFQEFDAVTNLGNQLMAVAVTGRKLDKENISKTIRYCDEHYQKVNSNGNGYHRWEDGDIVYIMNMEEKPDGSFRFLKTEDENGKLLDMKQLPMDNEVYTNVYFFILKKEAEPVIRGNNNNRHGVFMNF